MTTFNTIEDAFKNGFGDEFYIKDGKFIAINRHDDNSNLIMKGFEFYPLPDIRRAKNKKEKLVEYTIKYSPIEGGNYRDEYYDEFPDAYGQYL